MFYLFQLGHQPELSTAEIEAVVLSPENKRTKEQKNKNTKTLKHGGKDYLIIETEKEIDAHKLMNILGGTIKIGYGIRDMGYGKDNIINETIKYLEETQPTGKINFSLNDPKLALQIKKELKALGHNVRYIEPKNSATILYNGLIDKKTDLTIIDNQIFFTTAIQQFEEMAQRDYDRPGVDDKSGMLPPKLARMMINLAQIDANKTLLDPFCGSGTILTEALSMGYTNLIGSDISEKAIKDTKKNLEWLSSSYKLQVTSYKLFNSDARHLTNHLALNSIDAIATEPYLGKPLHGNETAFTIKKQANELAELYLEAFKSFYKILKPGGTVVFVIPKFKFKNEWIKIDCVEKIKKSGLWTIDYGEQSLTYHRPSQHLAREIYRFKKLPQ
jgi:tRNA G10  N-methylase Trm11